MLAAETAAVVLAMELETAVFVFGQQSDERGALAQLTDLADTFVITVGGKGCTRAGLDQYVAGWPIAAAVRGMVIDGWNDLSAVQAVM